MFIKPLASIKQRIYIVVNVVCVIFKGETKVCIVQANFIMSSECVPVCIVTYFPGSICFVPTVLSVCVSSGALEEELKCPLIVIHTQRSALLHHIISKASHLQSPRQPVKALPQEGDSELYNVS